MERTKAHDARMRTAARLHLLTSPSSPSFTRRHPRQTRLDRLSFLVSEQPSTQRYDA